MACLIVTKGGRGGHTAAAEASPVADPLGEDHPVGVHRMLVAAGILPASQMGACLLYGKYILLCVYTCVYVYVYVYNVCVCMGPYPGCST